MASSALDRKSGGSTAMIRLLCTFAVFGLALCSSLQTAAAEVRMVRPVGLHETPKVLAERPEDEVTDNKTVELQRFLEVARPVVKDRQEPICSMQLLYHEFAATYGVDPPAVQYIPSKNCGHWNKVVLKWSAVCRGRQYDRLAGVWLGGVEILRTCTAEPTQQGIIWEVEKDVTRYAALWKKPQELVVAMGNVITEVYTGIFNVTISVEFYREKHGERLSIVVGDKVYVSRERSKKEDWRTRLLERKLAGPADVILPFAEPSYKNGGYWFQLFEEGGSKNASIKVPGNTYRAVLEVCLSPHSNDEFWYTNLPNDFLKANNITNTPGNGAFREVQVSIDGQVVGTVWPFAVLYTGGVNPLFWRPLAAIKAFNLPSYDIDITPFVGMLVDGKDHTYSFTVTDNLDMWTLQGNLHIWKDPYKRSTYGNLIRVSAPPVTKNVNSDFQGLDGTFNTSATRTLSYGGYVISSFGNLSTTANYGFRFHNTISLTNGSSVQIVDQFTETDSTVVYKSSRHDIALYHDLRTYPFYLYYSQKENTDGSAVIFSNLTHTLRSLKQDMAPYATSFSFLDNHQSSDGFLYIHANNTLSGIAGTKQRYTYDGTDGCYRRDISARNYTIIFDLVSTSCSQSA